MDVALPVSEQQQIIVRERLRLLSIACYIRGGITAAFSSLFLIYVIFLFGITLVPARLRNHPNLHLATSSN
jgi:hypothetical protein